MSTSKKSIHQIINSLMELEAKGCHSTFFEYGNGMFRIRIFKGDASVENTVFEKAITNDEQSKLDEIYEHVNNMKYYVTKTSFKCSKREFIKGEKVGEWQEIKPCFEFGKNATSEMVISGTGYFITDPDNNLQYYVDYNNISKMQ